MEKDNVNAENANILSGLKPRVDSQQNSGNGKENMDLQKNEHLHSSQKAEQNQDSSDSSQGVSDGNHKAKGKKSYF